MTKKIDDAKLKLNENKKKLQSLFGEIPKGAGIYILTREQDDKKFAYIGQSVHILQRLAEHLEGYKKNPPQHIDLSLNAHGLKTRINETGWVLTKCIESEKLDSLEQLYIMNLQDLGYILLNKTAGGQHEGKVKINEFKPAKNYHDGLKQGRINAIKEIKHIIYLHLDVSVKSATKPHLKALDKFIDILNEVDNEKNV